MVRCPSVPVEYLCNFLVFIEQMFFASPSTPCAGSLVSACSHTLFSDALLIPPLHTNSALMGLQFVLVSHHPRTARPRSQHRCSLIVRGDCLMWLLRGIVPRYVQK